MGASSQLSSQVPCLISHRGRGPLLCSLRGYVRGSLTHLRCVCTYTTFGFQIDEPRENCFQTEINLARRAFVACCLRWSESDIQFQIAANFEPSTREQYCKTNVECVF